MALTHDSAGVKEEEIRTSASRIWARRGWFPGAVQLIAIGESGRILAFADEWARALGEPTAAIGCRDASRLRAWPCCSLSLDRRGGRTRQVRGRSRPVNASFARLTAHSRGQAGVFLQNRPETRNFGRFSGMRFHADPPTFETTASLRTQLRARQGGALHRVGGRARSWRQRVGHHAVAIGANGLS
jgi:hypothetical protein